LKIVELILENYKGIKKAKITNPSDEVILIGKNGSGKSTILLALNEILMFCFGYKQECSPGIKLVIDFSDHIEKLGDSNSIWEEAYISYISQYLSLGRSYHEKIFLYLKGIFIKGIKKSPIIIIDKGKFELKNKIDFPDNVDFNGFMEKNSYSKDKGLIFSLFIHQLLRTRSIGNQNIPGIVYLDMEKGTARDSTFSISQSTNVKNERIRMLYDQEWRKKNLGPRLISLILKYNKDTTSNINVKYENPVDRINYSLKIFTPHLTLISPEETDDKLKFNVRGKVLTINQLSSGEISLVNFAIDYLEIEVNSGILIIDEPGAHLHYMLQNRILSFIKDLSSYTINGEKKSPQIWVATHSPAIINSAKSESIYYVDIDNLQNAIIKLKEEKRTKGEKRLLHSLGINYYFKTPLLFIEGDSDKKILERILTKLNPELFDRWYFDYVEGVENINQLIKIHLEIEKYAKNIEILNEQLSQNHFLKDNDNNENQIKNENTCIWDFYHIENLLFLEPWFTNLKRIISHRTKTDTNIEEALNKAKKIVFDTNKELINDNWENIQKYENWSRKLPGRDLFSRWKGFINIGSFSEIDAFCHLINETLSIKDLPDDVIKFISWLDEKYEKWSS